MLIECQLVADEKSCSFRSSSSSHGLVRVTQNTKKTYGLLKSSRTTSAAFAVPTRVVVRRVEKICILGIGMFVSCSILFFILCFL